MSIRQQYVAFDREIVGALHVRLDQTDPERRICPGVIQNDLMIVLEACVENDSESHSRGSLPRTVKRGT